MVGNRQALRVVVSSSDSHNMSGTIVSIDLGQSSLVLQANGHTDSTSFPLLDKIIATLQVADQQRSLP
jgi:hypothetical protein